MTSPCTWPVDRTCLPSVADGDDAAAAKLSAAIDTAVAVLWSFTGRQFGACRVDLRPCPEIPDRSEYWPFWLPVWAWDMDIFTAREFAVHCGCGRRCRASGPGVVHLPGPVSEVLTVTIDGADIDSNLYVLEGDRLYARSGRWPHQDLRRPAGDPGTWTVTYLQGIEPPAGAATMVGLLAREFWNACTGDGKCRLPKRAESVARQGLSIKLSDPGALFEKQQTGIPEIDMWVQAVNPAHLAAPAAVNSPDYRPGGF